MEGARDPSASAPRVGGPNRSDGASAAAGAEAMRPASGRTSPESLRVARALQREADRRLWMMTVARTAALIGLAPVLALVSRWPDALHNLAILVVFILLGWMHLAVSRARPGANWPALLFAALDAALMTAAITIPNPLDADPAPVQAALRGGAFSSFFLLLTWLGFSLRPGVVLWGGGCCVTFWSLGRLALLLSPGTLTSFDLAEAATRSEELAMTLDPHFVDLRLWAQEVALLLAVSGMLALIVSGSREIVHRQVTLERRSANLSRYFPAALAERLAERDDPFVETQERRAAVLFTDIVGFTGWAEGRGSAEVMTFLRAAHAIVAGAVFETGGVLDKFIGDGAMATFGAAGDAPGGAADEPPEATDARNARAALTCVDLVLARFEAFDRARVADGNDRMRISIGLHFGPVIVGDVGDERRMELAVLGDTVNVASRLERLTRTLRCGAAASQETIDAAGGAPQGWRLAGVQAIPGRRTAEIVWVRSPPEPPEPGAPEEDRPAGPG